MVHYQAVAIHQAAAGRSEGRTAGGVTAPSPPPPLRQRCQMAAATSALPDDRLMGCHVRRVSRDM